MAEEASNTMNLDLNLDPGPEADNADVTNEIVNVSALIDETRRLRDLAWQRRRRWRWRRVLVPNLPRPGRNSMELNQIMDSSGNVSSLQVGEGSVPVEDERTEEPKTCEINNGCLDDETSESKGDFVKPGCDDGSFFDCNICLDLAKDPVVTCCGHLFCWSCLYRWLHYHSEAKECPVCKGEVTVKNVTPIYGRGNNLRESEEDGKIKIPLRPQARKVESLRQTIQRTGFTYPLEDMVRRLGNRFDLTRDYVPSQGGDNSRETFSRAHALLNRIMTSSGIRRDQQGVLPPGNMVDLTQGDISSTEAEESTYLQPLLLPREQSNSPSLSYAYSPGERQFLRGFSTDRNPNHPLPVEDLDSFSSIIAVSNSENQIDTTMEIDSVASLSSSSARGRNDGSRVSDVENRESRAPRRRRLN